MTIGKIIGKTIANAYTIADGYAIGYANANFYVMTYAMPTQSITLMPRPMLMRSPMLSNTLMNLKN